jgi:hypothetical protein
MTEQEKNEIIKKIYYSKTGFGNAYNTFKDAKTKDPSITLEFVKNWIDKNIVKTKQIGGTKNSYVAPQAYFEYQVDLFFITPNQMPKQNFRVGLSCIDVFSKYAVVVPLKNKKAPEIVRGILEAFKQIGKQPEIVYTDMEGGLFEKDVVKLFEDASIQHIASPMGAHFVERFNRTFKSMMHKRIEYLKTKDKEIVIQWTDLIPQILATYNNKNKHTATGFTPSEAKKPSNEIDVKTSLELKAKTGKQFPPIEIGDKVKVLRKKKLGEKEHIGNLRKGNLEVVGISENFSQKFYKLSDGREYIRSDIVKI